MTAAGNHVIPNVHFRKVNGMQHGRHNRVMMRTWLDQAGRKKRRSNNRKAKAAKLSPRPAAGMLHAIDLAEVHVGDDMVAGCRHLGNFSALGCFFRDLER